MAFTYPTRNFIILISAGELYYIFGHLSINLLYFPVIFQISERERSIDPVLSRRLRFHIIPFYGDKVYPDQKNEIH